VSEHLVFNQILRQSARCLISDLVVGQVEFDDRGARVSPGEMNLKSSSSMRLPVRFKTSCVRAGLLDFVLI
jgi:hypothetical protein